MTSAELALLTSASSDDVVGSITADNGDVTAPRRSACWDVTTSPEHAVAPASTRCLDDASDVTRQQLTTADVTVYVSDSRHCDDVTGQRMSSTDRQIMSLSSDYFNAVDRPHHHNQQYQLHHGQQQQHGVYVDPVTPSQFSSSVSSTSGVSVYRSLYGCSSEHDVMRSVGQPQSTSDHVTSAMFCHSETLQSFSALLRSSAVSHQPHHVAFSQHYSSDEVDRASMPCYGTIQASPSTGGWTSLADTVSHYPGHFTFVLGCSLHVIQRYKLIQSLRFFI